MTAIGGAMRLLRVPSVAPALPANAGDAVESVRPARGYLWYLRMSALMRLLAIGSAAVLVSLFVLIDNEEGALEEAPRASGGLLGMLSSASTEALIVAIGGLALALVVGVVFWISSRFRYETTWYVVGERSVRIRTGFWIIRETTITYENVQNIAVNQGPMQRLLGISTVGIETAGGATAGTRGGGGRPLMIFLSVVFAFLPGGAALSGVGARGNKKKGGCLSGAVGRMDGLADAAGVRTRIMELVRSSRSAGLGDEGNRARGPAGVGAEHLETLRGIRDALA